jgi:hypothetical protein
VALARGGKTRTTRIPKSSPVTGCMVEFFLIRKTESNNTFSQGTQQTKTGFQINLKYGKMPG